MHLSNEARAYKQEVYLRARAAGIRPIAVPADVEVTIQWFRGRKSGDLDKRVSILLDALQGAAYDSDAQIVAIHAMRIDGDPIPRVDVTVFEAKNLPLTIT
jgi:Holliday junction resolvase RusA-like endonuclease